VREKNASGSAGRCADAAHGYTRLKKDMASAIDRGQKKSKVYAMAVSVLGTENAI
jgi:hypothetical protein